MRQLFYLLATLLLLRAFFPAVASGMETAVLALLSLANSALAGAGSLPLR